MEHGSAVTGGERAPGGQRGQLQECGLYPEGVDFTRSRSRVGFRRGAELRRSLGAFTVASSTWEVWTLPT